MQKYDSLHANINIPHLIQPSPKNKKIKINKYNIVPRKIRGEAPIYRYERKIKSKQKRKGV